MLIELSERQINGIAGPASGCDIARHAEGEQRPCFERLVRARVCGCWRALAARTRFAAAPPQRIVAVGDLHGDYQAWITIARAAGVIDARGHWAGGKTILVQLGDITDREPDSLKIVRSLQQLQKEAPRKGGKVVRRPRQPRGDEPARRQSLHDAGRICRVRRQPVRRAPRPRLRRQPSEAREPPTAQDPEAHARADPRSLDGRASARLGRAQARLEPVGRARQMGDAQPGGRQDRRHACSSTAGSAPNMRSMPIDEVNRRVAAAMAAGDDSPASILTDPLGPLWYRGLVGSDADARGRARRGQAAARRARPPIRSSTRCLPLTARSGSSSPTRRASRASRSPATAAWRASIPASRATTADR